MNQYSLKHFAVLSAIWCTLASSSLGAEFHGLGDLPGGGFSSKANGISADGTTVVGQSSGQGLQAFRWTSSTGMTTLPFLPGSEQISQTATAVNADGSVIVGSDSNGTGLGVLGFRWTSSGGSVQLPNGAGGLVPRHPLAISYNGNTVVGGEDFGASAFRWTPGGGTVEYKSPNGVDHPFSDTAATGISADGSHVAGTGRADFFREAFYNVPEFYGSTSIFSLGIGASTATGISGSGDVIIGYTGNNEAFRWTAGDGLQTLGDLSGGTVNSRALATNGDGSKIVGTGTNATSEVATIWSEDFGMINLKDYLVARGATGLTGWNLTAATGISGDGFRIVGTGFNPDGAPEAWIAIVPEPSGFVLVALGLIGLAVWRRRRR
jgi:uncharacterized membrane protein